MNDDESKIDFDNVADFRDEKFEKLVAVIKTWPRPGSKEEGLGTVDAFLDVATLMLCGITSVSVVDRHGSDNGVIGTVSQKMKEAMHEQLKIFKDSQN